MKRYQFEIFSSILVFVGISCAEHIKTSEIVPGKIWNDTDGNPINAHGGGMLFHDGKYYWYGEIKEGKTWLVPDQNWECYRVNAGGVSCYSSENLADWKYEGVALAPNLTDSTNDLHTSKVLERPKVIYNDMTKKYVMWLHVDTEDYSYSHAGIAISDTPQGPFTYLGSILPNNYTSRDMTLFKDDDGKAYHIFTSEMNSVMHVSLLTDDYQQSSGIERRVFIDKNREAPAMFKYHGKYYLITSGCTGWDPNKAILASADSILGNWKEMYNPCIGENGNKTFMAQSTYVFPIEGKPDHYIFMADRWNRTNLVDSRYVWLALVFRNDSIQVEWKDSWKLVSP